MFLRATMIKPKLKTILTISFAFVGMISIFILIFLINFYLKKYFREYSIQKQEDRNQQVVNLIKNQYHKDNYWNKDMIQDIGVSMLEEGLIIKLTDVSGGSVWDAMEYNSGICERMMENIKIKMQNKYPSLQGEFSNKIYLLNNNGKPIGNLQIGYYSPFFYTDTEFLFIDALNKLIIIITISTLVISIFIGFIISKLLSIPIGNVIITTGKISKGFYNIRINKESIIDEYQKLINSINELAGSLEVQDKLRKQLTLDVSHELRTPLTTLQTHIEAMIDGIWKPTQKRLKSFYEEILRLKNIVNDLTTLSHYEHETLKLDKTKVDLNKLINSMLLIYKNQLKNKKVFVECTGDYVELSIDKDKFNQVLTNLISNAVKYTNKNGYFKIRLKSTVHEIKLFFTNSGKGIPEEDIPFIFERFYRVDKSRARATGNAGIGLSIVKEIILAHNGFIEVSSNHKNETTFIITLPK